MGIRDLGVNLGPSTCGFGNSGWSLHLSEHLYATVGTEQCPLHKINASIKLWDVGRCSTDVRRRLK